ncbi:hypothetical protein Fmac_031975 [Flemingia macrophylla]|uniref:Cation/H+ exchanger domain-containing protein n=1 Tax=Flemingia macrophylla TaxID=520843 RepID=A0ABD1L3K5_9FABA
MVAGYANREDMKAAKELYDVMNDKNEVTWVAMIAGYGKLGTVSEARRAFDEAPAPQGASAYAAMLACYAQNGYATVAIDMYRKMKEAKIKITEVTMVAAISACAQLRDIRMSKILSLTILRSVAVDTYCFQCIDPYALKMWKCKLSFERIQYNERYRDIHTYSAMIAALAEHGKSQDAIVVFLKMQKEGLKPNEVTFIGLLNACASSGHIGEACRFFQIMTGVGLILGPSLKIFEKDKMMLFPYGSQDTLTTIASLGYVLFVFENGVKMDFSMITRVGKPGWVIASLGLALPLSIGAACFPKLSTILSQGIEDKGHSAVVILMTQNVTSFAVIASILNDLQILNSELGRLTLSCGLVGDIISNILLSLKDAVSLALLLNCKGVVEASMYSSALDKNDIQTDIYTVIMTAIMITSSIVHLLVKRLYDPSRKYGGYQKRNIFGLKPKSRLRIQVCIHKQHHTIPMIKALDLFNPTQEDPIIVDVLHLIELVGRSSPIFISHRINKSFPSRIQNSYSENIIHSFKLYEDDKQRATSINPYTAISPRSLMHEDVCYLALDKVASIIILPFHRKWSIDGKIEHEDKAIRSLNCKLMEKAPCSIGILVSRFVHQRDSPLRLAMIFLGGNDDREALCIANRAAKVSNVNLVVYHITINNMNELQDMDTLLDLALLKDANKKSSSLKNVIHKEIIVEGTGAQITSILCQMIDEHDFFIVGRRHGIHCPLTKGLQEWSEFSELGLIGDFLASTDLDCKSSVLVVQQQQFAQ